MVTKAAVHPARSGIRRRLVFVATTVVFLVGCQATPGPVTQPPATDQPATIAPGETPEPPAAITINVLDGMTTEGADLAASTVYANFEAANPGITIARTTMGHETRQATLRASLTAGTGPDVFMENNGDGNVGILARAGLLRPLSEIPGLNLEELTSPMGLTQSTYDGTLYGIGYSSELLGVYYNMTLLNELGLSVPTTDAELLEFCADATAQGYVPLAFTNRPGWQSFHQLAMIANNAIGGDALNELLFSNVGRWDDDRIVEAVRFYFIEMNEAGCFPENVNAVEYEAGQSQFVSGRALGVPTGSWVIQELVEAMPEAEIAFETFPSLGSGSRVLPVAVTEGWFVSASAENLDAIAKFLAFVSSPESNKIVAEHSSLLPAGPVDVESLNVPGLQRSAIAVAQEAAQGIPGQELGPWIDTVAPEPFLNTMQNGFQAVVAGTTTPEQQMAALQADWEAGWVAHQPE